MRILYMNKCIYLHEILAIQIMRRYLFILFFSPCLLFAGGFQISMQSHKATGMGGAFSALSSDASSVFYNPGGMLNLQGSQFTLGGTLISPSVSLRTQVYSNIDQTSKNSTPFHAYYTHRLNEKISLGMGINNQFGSSSSFEDDWQGRYIVQNISLKTFMFQPTAAYGLHEKLSLGAGFVFATGNFSYNKALPISSATTDYGRASLSGSGQSVGFNVGLYSRFYEKQGEKWLTQLSASVAYRSSLMLKLNNGQVDFNDIPLSLQDKFPPSQKFTSSMRLPAVFTGGIALKLSDSTNYSIQWVYDVNYTFWSVYDTLAFDFENELTPDSKTPKNWRNTFTHRLGIEFTWREKYIFRAGVYADQTPIPDGYVSPELPDNSHVGITLGAGYKLNDNISIDFSFLRSSFERMNASLDAEGFVADYRRIVNVFGLGLNVKIPGNKGKKQAAPSIE